MIASTRVVSGPSSHVVLTAVFVLERVGGAVSNDVELLPRLFHDLSALRLRPVSCGRGWSAPIRFSSHFDSPHSSLPRQ